MYAHIVDSVSRPLPDIVVLSLRPKSPGRPMRFFAGQYATLSLVRHGRRTPVRCFSMISSPSDSHVLQFAAKVEGKFTHALAELRPGDTVDVQGPFGEFVIDPEQDRRVVMLAGGIGITPFVSMLRYLSDTQLKLPVTLLYSCRSTKNIPLYDEILEGLRALPGSSLQLFVTRQSGEATLSASQVTQGRITSEWLDRITQHEHRGSTYFICGPSSFIQNIQAGLRERDVAEARIITESFAQAPGSITDGTLSPAKVVYGLTAAALVIGVLGVAYMDLVRNVPKLMSSQSGTQQTTPYSHRAGTSSSTNSSSSASSSTSSTSGANMSNTSGNDTPNPVYQQPVSGVS